MPLPDYGSHPEYIDTIREFNGYRREIPPEKLLDIAVMALASLRALVADYLARSTKLAPVVNPINLPGSPDSSLPPALLAECARAEQVK